MNRLFVLLVAAFLVGCGGGGGSTPVTPVTPSTPTPSPASQHRLVVTWTGANQSGTALDQMRRTLSTVTLSPVTLGAAPTISPPPANVQYLGPTTANPGMAQATVNVTEVDASGSPVPVSSASVTPQSPNVAQVSPLASPPPDTQRFVASPLSVNAASTALTVTTADASGTTSAKVYNRIVVEGGSVYADASHGYTFDASGNAVPVSSCSGADICIGKPTSGTATPVQFPGGYALVSLATTTFANYLQAPVPFTSAGTTIRTDDPNFSTNIIVAKVSTGYVALVAQSAMCSGDQSLCDGDAGFVALFKWAPASGTFSL